MPYDKPITIEKMDPETENWSHYLALHARVNKNSQRESVSGGAVRPSRRLTFELRYFSKLAEIPYNTQLYRITYRGHVFNIVDTDDFMEQHRTMKLIAESYE